MTSIYQVMPKAREFQTFHYVGGHPGGVEAHNWLVSMGGAGTASASSIEELNYVLIWQIDGSELRVSPNSWIIKVADGLFHAYPNEVFRQLFSIFEEPYPQEVWDRGEVDPEHEHVFDSWYRIAISDRSISQQSECSCGSIASHFQEF